MRDTVLIVVILGAMGAASATFAGLLARVAFPERRLLIRILAIATAAALLLPPVVYAIFRFSLRGKPLPAGLPDAPTLALAPAAWTLAITAGACVGLAWATRRARPRRAS